MMAGSFLVVAGSIAACGETANADVRAASPAELNVPKDALDRLASDLGLVMSSPSAADVAVGVADGAVALAMAESEYASQVESAQVTQYLLQVEESAGTTASGLSPDQLVWLVHFTGMSIESGAPLTESGEPAESATIHQGYVLPDASDGSFVLAHWTD